MLTLTSISKMNNEWQINLILNFINVHPWEMFYSPKLAKDVYFLLNKNCWSPEEAVSLANIFFLRLYLSFRSSEIAYKYNFTFVVKHPCSKNMNKRIIIIISFTITLNNWRKSQNKTVTKTWVDMEAFSSLENKTCKQQ